MGTSQYQKTNNQNIKLRETIMKFDYGYLSVFETEDVLVLGLCGLVDEEAIELPENEDILLEFGDKPSILYKAKNDFDHFLIVNKNFEFAEITARMALSYLDFRNDCMGDPPDPTYE